MIALVRKLFQLFDRNDRRSIALLAVTVFARAIAETVGVASIMPFMVIVANPSVVQTNRWLHRTYVDLGFKSTSSFLMFVGLVMLAVMVVTNAISAYTTWYSQRFVWNKYHKLSMQLLTQYLREPYSYFLNLNTATLGKNILGEVGNVVRGLLTPLINALASAFVATYLLVLLFIVQPKLAAIVLVVMGGSYGGLYALIRKRQSRIGWQRVEANRKRFQIAGEAFGAIKDLKISHREMFFVDAFDHPSKVYGDTTASNQVIKEAPRYALQTLAFGGIVLVVLYLLSNGKDLASVIPVLSLYALAGYRLLPALQQVFSGVVEVRFNVPALDVIHEDLMRGKRAVEEPKRPAPPLRLEREFALEGITFTYDRAQSPAIRDLSLRVERNTTIGFIGSTGAGKTTLVDIILGLLRPQNGRLTVDGAEIGAQDIERWQRLIGYVPQHIYLSDNSLRRNIAFAVRDDDIDEDRVRRAAAIANLDGLIAELPKGLATRVGERGIRLSGGQRQRIGIARALYQEPEVLILDEATSALDGITESVVMEAIHALTKQKTIILIAHRLTTVRDCDTIYLLEGGRIVAHGTYNELLRNSSVVRAMALAADTSARENGRDETSRELTGAAGEKILP